MSGFVHLHLHSEYSLLDGACRIADIPRLAKEAGHTAVALTDHGAMFGVVPFYRACQKEGIRPIIGCEVYVAARTRFDRDVSLDARSYHLVLLCENEEGYKNLIALVSAGYTQGFYSRPRVDTELLAAHAKGLIALSGCIGGRIPQYILQGDMNNALLYAQQMRDIFGKDNFYLELQDHGKDEELRVNSGLRTISQKTGIPMVCTNDVHYAKKSDAETQAVLMCIQTNRTIQDGRPEGFDSDSFYYKSTEEMEQLFASFPSAVENTVRIAERCRFDFTFDKLYLPKFPTENGETAQNMLRRLAEQGLMARLKSGDIPADAPDLPDAYKSRMNYELFIINRMGYDDYFLIVWDFVNFAKTHDVPVGPGRGSGAGSLVAYLLHITEVDPIRFGLLFERFLNPERVSMPDFDIDFGHEKRSLVVDYVAERYGADHVAQICAFDTLAARAAVRDVGRALGMPYGDVDEVAKAVPRKLGITLQDACRESPLREIYESNASSRMLIDIAMSLEGMPRHVSTHAAGVVISDRPVCEYVPLAQGNTLPLIQYDMDVVASLGLLKFDFLGLRYLTIIEDAAALVRAHTPDFDPAKIPEDDAETFALISQGKTTGVFQLESAGMRQMLQSFCPNSISDIMVAIALYRPGPMDSIPKYLENRKSPEKIQYEIPKIEPILRETHGCIVYQEQVMQICRTVANYSYGRADMIRRAMSKKKAAEMEKEREGFLQGARVNFINVDAANRLFDEMASFASYAFNKSHAASYAYTSYRTAYLKAHYPAEYFAALLSSVLGNQSKMAEYIEDASQFGIRVQGPDVNESDTGFTVGNGAIRFGLLGLKNVGIAFAQTVVSQSKVRPFTDFSDFLRRCSGGDFNRRAVESVIRCGGCDSLGLPRSVMLATFEELLDRLTDRSHGDIEGQIGLFGEENPLAGFVYPQLDELSKRDKIQMETETACWSFSGHLSDEYARHAAALCSVGIGTITRGEEDADGAVCTVCGILTRRTVKQTRRGEDMCFFTLEDRSGNIEVLCFPELFRAVGAYLTADAPLGVMGTLSAKEEEAPKLLARQIVVLVADPMFDPATAPAFDAVPARKAPLSKQAHTPSASAPSADKLHGQSQVSTDQATKTETLYLKLPSLQDPVYRRVCALSHIFPGPRQVVLYDGSQGKYFRDRSLTFSAESFIIDRLRALLGEEQVVLRP